MDVFSLIPDDVLKLAELEQQGDAWKRRWGRILRDGDPRMADGIYYRDLRRPFVTADQGQVTLAATDKALYTPSAHPVLGGQYYDVGKKSYLRVFGKITTAATPGNLTIGVYYGSGADATGVLLQSSAAQTLLANQSNISFEIELRVHCRSAGSVGTLFVDGKATFGTAVIAAGSFLIPASAAAVSGACDLTQANIISVQAKRSGSTAETMTVQDIEFESLN